MLFVLFFLPWLSGCALRMQHLQIADAQQFEKQVVSSDHFKHLVYARQPSGSETLHVYIEGDGRSWINGVVVAADPTPHNPLALQLMALDKNPAVYIGRPCHYILQQDAACEPDIWTFKRYSAQVVASMLDAIRQMVRASGAQRVVLIGYSGGGVLALLAARQIPSVTALITVASNLDIDAWTRVRGFEPLTGSLNPVNQPPLPSSIRQLHLIGGRDTVVPPAVTLSYTNQFGAESNLRVREYADFDHVCCWVQQWPEILRQNLGD